MLFGQLTDLNVCHAKVLLVVHKHFTRCNTTQSIVLFQNKVTNPYLQPFGVGDVKRAKLLNKKISFC